MNGVLRINTEGLMVAAEKYQTAKEKYETVMQEIVSQIKNIEDNWNEATTGEWKTRLDSAKANLESVRQRLDLNATILKKIVQEIIKTEGNVQRASSGY